MLRNATAMAEGKSSPLARLLLLVQFVLLAAVLIFSVAEKASASPHGVAAGVIVMLCVCAMACQYALLRLACPLRCS